MHQQTTVMLEIKLTSVIVDDQQKALEFYTGKLGFITKHDIPMGEGRWLTVTTPGKDDVELLLEPMAFEPSKVYQKALFEAGIPLTAFAVRDMKEEYERLIALGVKFRSEPKAYDTTVVAAFEDTCGNIIQLFQV